ncbi:MAG: hypothetical protein HY904_09130 [Deltaproteobacteria bacterium]|nr:hypothetical protein [Deltaproteobacteria bacterium]
MFAVLPRGLPSLLAVCALAACTPPWAVSRTCRSNQDCAAGDVCQSEQCITACNTDRDCVNQRTCLSGVCVVPASCAEDGDCRIGELCLRGRCMSSSVPCENQAACPDGLHCTNGLCGRSLPDGGSPGSSSSVATSGPPPVSSSAAPGTSQPAPPSSAAAASSSAAPLSSSAPDLCQGRDNGLLGDSCTGASGCCNGLCLGSGTRGYCTEFCTDYRSCNPPGFPQGYACLDIGTDRLCVVADWEQACAVPADCVGQVCLKGDGATGCSWRCRQTADCPAGSACGPVAVLDENGNLSAIRACAPVGAACTVNASGLNACLSGTCLTESTTNTGYCTAFCDVADPQPCPAGYTCTLVDVSQPRVCVR